MSMNGFAGIRGRSCVVKFNCFSHTIKQFAALNFSWETTALDTSGRGCARREARDTLASINRGSYED